MKANQQLQITQLYTVQKNGDQVWDPRGPIAWSVTNVLVCPSSTASHRYFLHFSHPDTPWDVSVNATPHTSLITKLKFDGKGVLLCAIDAQSNASIWRMQGNILNDWQLVQITDSVDSSSFTIDTQPVLCMSWTNTAQNYARKTWTVKSDDISSHWTSKFTKVGLSTLLKSKVQDVSLVTITSRGLISIMSPGKKVRTSYLPITNMQAADIIVPCGELFAQVATVDFNCTLRLYTVETMTVNIKFGLSRIVQLSPENPNIRVVDLKFDNSLVSDSDFFVLLQDADCSRVERWKLSKRNVPVNPVLSPKSDSVVKVDWEKQHSASLPLSPTFLHVPELPFSLSTPSDPNRIGRVVLITTKAGAISVLDRSTLAELDTMEGSSAGCITLSPLACCLASLTNNTVSVHSFRNNDISEPESETVWLASLLEHCILNNVDHWEIMAVATRRDDMLSRLEIMLNRSFDAQCPEVRQLYFSRVMSIKMMLYKLQPSTSHWPGQLWSCLFLNCLSEKFRSLLSYDTLNNFLIPPDIELHNLLSLVETKQFALPEAVLLAQQPLFQWAVDYAQLLSLSVLPQKRTPPTSNWQSVVTDSKTLANLRDTLGLIKIWTTLSPRSAPVLHGSDELSSVFKCVSLLVKQFPCKSDIPNSDYDKIQLFQQRITTIPKVIVSALSECTSAPLPLSYHFQFEPNSIKCAVMLCDRPALPLSLVNSVINSAGRDMIRNTVLSATSLHIKQDFIKECVVCGCVTTIHPPPAQPDWWSRWKHACICGGSWRKPSVLA